MRGRHRQLLALAALLLLFDGAAQCGGRTEQPTLRRAPEGPPSASALMLAEAECDYLERCDADAMHLFASSSRQACLDFFGCENQLPWPIPRIPGPASMLAACVESLRARACPDTEKDPINRFSYSGQFPFGPSCGIPALADLLAPPTGAPHKGESCVEPVFHETAICQGDNYCAVGDPSRRFGTYYCGICAPEVMLGEPCDGTTPCIAGATCILGRCAIALESGEACTVPDECRWGRCEGGVCGRSPYAPDPYDAVIGQECDNVGACGNQAGLRCDSGHCRPLGDEGDACTDAPSSLIGSCRLGQYCLDNRCVALGCTLDLGEPCRFFCHEADCLDGVCVPLGTSIGSRCGTQCAKGLACVQERCAAAPSRGNGDACDFDADCDSDFCDRDLRAYCSGNSCSVIPSCNRCGICAAAPTVASCI